MTDRKYVQSRVSPVGQAMRKRLSYDDLRDMPKVDRTHVPLPDNTEEPCYAVFNNVAWDLNEMTKGDPRSIPEGWDGRRGDVVFRKSRDYPDDEIIMARIVR